ncbi:YAP-binding/ALF4/Glomulin [Lipomyces kononenkoae]|uniref:YAP-binding/ALF4/Glomulin n=1 Tax=Lipomyces kononenkoae TaxID=34357 RepID=A0ACC3SVT2_LIPKO
MSSNTAENTASIQDAIRALTDAAHDAVNGDDYITYSTLLDVYLGNPNRYNESERVTLLQTLETILRQSEILLSYVAWDLPVLLLPYLASAEPFDTVTTSKVLTPRKAALRIFNLIAEKGNAKEVFLKSIEALSTLNVDFSLDATPEQNLDREKLFVLKFYALFEVIISVTRRITTQYPSRFLTTSSTALLSFFSSHVDELSDQSLPVLLRRLYLFARDYVPPPSKTAVEPEEEALQRRMLQSYVTHMVEIMLRSKSVDWSRRYFAAIKPEIDVLPMRERDRPLSFDGALSPSIMEMLERFLQLTSSFDIAPEAFAETVLAEPPEMEPDNEPEVDPSFPSPPTSSSSIPLSAEGCFFLLAEFLISEPRSTISFTFPDIIKLTKRFIISEEGESPGLGVCDAVGFYAWKYLQNITREEIEAVSPEEFNGYLQVLTSLSATSSSPTVRFIFHTLVVHLLSRSSPERSYNYIYDTLQFCPFENVCGAFVIVLKDFLDVSSPETAESPTCRIVYDDTKRKQVEDLIQSCLSAIETSPDLLLDERYPTLLAWVNNFLVVVGGDKSFLDAIRMRVNALIRRDKSTSKDDTDDDERTERNVRAGILSAGMELLERTHNLESALKNLSISGAGPPSSAVPAAAT